MYLLNDHQILGHLKKGPLGYLSIENFDESQLNHTSYYFRLGREIECYDEEGEAYDKILTPQKSSLVLKPNEYAIVKSIEKFYLSEKVMAIIGSLGNNTSLGLQLVYSPFIDPLYKGTLEIGIKNYLNSDIQILFKQPIGKLSFFDISDTYPVEIRRGSSHESKFKERAIEDGVDYEIETEDK